MRKREHAQKIAREIAQKLGIEEVYNNTSENIQFCWVCHDKTVACLRLRKSSLKLLNLISTNSLVLLRLLQSLLDLLFLRCPVHIGP